MKTVILSIPEKKEKWFLSLFDQLHVKHKILSREEKEEAGLLKAMLAGKKGDYVNRETIMKALQK